MRLNIAQKRQLQQQGYVQIPAVVPGIMVGAALRAINHSMGEGMDPQHMPVLRSRSYCPELHQDPVITDLLHRTPAWDALESVLGAGNVNPATAGQIALRFPTDQDPQGVPAPHLDGTYSPHNGVPKGELQSFTALVSILLSDVPTPNSGNFTVWPGSHLLYEDFFKNNSPESLLEGMPQVELPQPEQITGKAGDIVLSHYQVGHTVAPNTSPHIRYAVFFRLHHVNHQEQKWERLSDIWRGWDGMSELNSLSA